MPRVTIKDVAARAGVSTRTVSVVLNQNGFVSQSLTHKVLDAVQELGYRPNHIARSLRRQSTDTVGVLVSTIRNAFLPMVIREIDDVLSARGLSILFANTKESKESEAALISLMRQKCVDGLLIVVNDVANVPLLEQLSSDGCPVVTLQNALAEGRLDCVRFDDFQGSFDAVRHLIQNGRRRVAIVIAASIDRSASAEDVSHRPAIFPPLLPRLLGYEAALTDAGLSLDPSLYLVGSTVEQATAIADARQLALRALQCQEPPDAVFVTNTPTALGVLEAARMVGCQVPQDLAIVGYDDYPWVQHVNPPLSVVVRDAAEMGRRAADLLVRRLGSKADAGPETICLPTQLIVRASSCSVGKKPG